MSASAIPPTNPAIWSFTIGYHPQDNCDVRATGSSIHASSAEEVRGLAKLAGLPVTEYCDQSIALQIAEPEGSPALLAVLQGIKDLYGFDLAAESLIPNRHRFFFHVQKTRVFTREQIDAAKFLVLRAGNVAIGNHRDPTPEEVASETYVVANDGKLRSKVDFGYIFPFSALGISDRLKEQLEKSGLAGLRFAEIVVRRKPGVPLRKQLWKLESAIILPRSTTRYINKFGAPKEPFDDWSDRWECAYFDDHGYHPAVLSYAAADLESLGAFDIALTAERTGNGPRIAFREAIISQRFRGVLTELDVPGADYIPVYLH